MNLSSAWLWFQRDWRTGPFRLLMLAVILSVAGSSTVNFFIDRVQRLMEYRSNELLAADIRIEGSAPIPLQWRDYAEQLGLSMADITTMPSVIVTEDDTLLTSVKAVSQGYPLRGGLKITPRRDAEERVADAIPLPGQVWVEPRLLDELEINVGDQVQLGDLQLTIAALITDEPDRSGNLLRLAPRVMINQADMKRSGLILPGSRVQYHLLLAGEAAAVGDYRQWLKSRIQNPWALRGLEQARPELRTALDRSERLFSLVSLIITLLAAVAIGIAAHLHSQRHKNNAAIMRCLGAGSRYLQGLFIAELLFVLPIALVIGGAIGLLGQEILLSFLSDYLPQDLPAPGIGPWLSALSIAVICLLGFALPPLLRVVHVPPMHTLRPTELAGKGLALRILPGLVAVALLFLIQGRDLQLLALLGLGIVGLLLALAAVAWLVLHLAALTTVSAGSNSWRFALRNLMRRRYTTLLQAAALGIGLMSVLLIGLLQGQLVDEWQASLPKDAPNHFLINIAPDEAQDLAKDLAALNIDPPYLYPMTRGRLWAINGLRVNADDYASPRAQRLARREFNLSSLGQERQDNVLLQGKWWTAENIDQPLVSVESGIAGVFAIEVGDTLAFQVAGQVHKVTVANIREVDWGSFQPNFFMVMTPTVLESLPKTYITSFYLPEEARPAIPSILQNYPSVTMLDIDALINRVRGLLSQLTLALDWLFVFVLLAGGLIVLAAVELTREQRRKEIALMKALGGRRSQLVRAAFWEFVLLGSLSGISAAILAWGTGWALANYVLDLPYQPDILLAIIGIVLGSLTAILSGWPSVRKTLQHPPMAALKAS